MPLKQCDLSKSPLWEGPRCAEVEVEVKLSRAAIVVNPVKFKNRMDLTSFMARVDGEFQRQGWGHCMWLPTTASTRGAAEARIASVSGADVVVAAGGDGTIRTVAEELLYTGMPMGLLPSGTGNLLARNLGIPHNDLSEAVKIICQGQDSPMDVGSLELDRYGHGTHTERHSFLVMAGIGLDAEIMAGAGERAKQRLGHAAYLVSGLYALGRATTAANNVRVDGTLVASEPSHGVVVGNCGNLTMGMSLMPDASPDDGMLNAVVLLPRSTAAWARVAWALCVRKGQAKPPLPPLRGAGIEIRSETAQPVQVDGDGIGLAYGIRTNLHTGALLIRRPVLLPLHRSSTHASQVEVSFRP
jgi:diacylglycerol kinase (ATP)